MKNEYGEMLDHNGYAPSIMQPRFKGHCYLCDRSGDLARHEVFFGPYRQKSKADGLWVYLCPECHQGTAGVHGRDGRPADLWLKRCGQIAAMYRYGWTTMEFIARYGRNYRED